MIDTLILSGLAIVFLLVVFLLIEIYRLRKKFKEAEVDAIQQVNLTIKSLETELQQIRADFDQHLADVKKD